MKNDNNKIENPELIKALQTIFSEDELKEMEADLSKAEKAEVEVEINSEEEEDDDMEKAYKKAEAEAEELEKALKAKSDELAGLKEKMKKGCDAKIEKAEKEDISFEVNDDLKKALEESTARNAEILKSVQDLREENQQMKEELQKIGNQPQGRKGYQNLNVIEKADGSIQDEDSGKTILSVKKNKGQVEKLMDTVIKKAEDPELKTKWENELIGFNAGSAPFSKSLQNEIEKEGVILTA
jgi:hypothetical protein